MGISSIIELYLANHLSAVMGPVQLSELSQELKPAPEEAGTGDSAGRTRLWLLQERAGGRLGEGGLVPMDCPGCLVSWELPVSGQAECGTQ